MPEFLKLHSVEEAKSILWQHVEGYQIKGETIETVDACGRFLFASLISQEYLPAFSRSSMDGYAVQVKDTYGASDNLPNYLKLIDEVPMGQAPRFTLHIGEAALIHTGGMLPAGADAVVILEQAQVTGQQELEVFKAVSSGENVILKGEDVKPGDVVIPAGKQLRPAEIGGLLALGHVRVQVAKKPRVAILSSGDEVIAPDQEPEIGQVRDINTGALSSLIRQAGGEVKTYPIIPDQREQMERIVRQAYIDADMVVITAGSSASTRDMTAEVIAGLGKPGILVHGINIKPGKPTILAVCDGKPVIGLPGNPISALVIALFFVRPLLYRLQGLLQPLPEASVKARLNVNLASLDKKENWIPVRLIKQGNAFEADPIFFKSNLIFQLSNADGLFKIPADINGLQAGTDVDVILL